MLLSHLFPCAHVVAAGVSSSSSASDSVPDSDSGSDLGDGEEDDGHDSVVAGMHACVHGMYVSHHGSSQCLEAKSRPSLSGKSCGGLTFLFLLPSSSIKFIVNLSCWGGSSTCTPAPMAERPHPEMTPEKVALNQRTQLSGYV